MIEVLGENHGCHKQKNEGAFLLEWIAYHKTIGFTDIVILSNDCEDGSDEMLDHLSKSGEIIHLRNDGPYDDRGIQFAALKRADRQKAVKEADWIIHLDIDEFLNIHVGDGQIADLIAALPDADAIALTSDNPSRECYKLQLARRDMLRHLRTLLGRAQARPGPLLTKLVCQHTLRLHPTAPKFIAALQQVEQTAAE